MCIRAFVQSSVNFSFHVFHNLLIFRFYIYYYVTMYLNMCIYFCFLGTILILKDLARISLRTLVLPHLLVISTFLVDNVSDFYFFFQLLKYMLDSRKERWTLSVSSLALSSSNKENALEWMSCIRLFPLSEEAT